MPYRPSDVPARLILGVWGEPKSGKSHFGLMAPEPVYVLNLDFGIAELLCKPEFRSRDITIEDIPVVDPGVHESGQAALALFHKTYLDFLTQADAHGGTVVIDNGTFLWDLVQTVKLEEAKRARFEKQSKVKNFDDLKEQRFDYGPVNVYMSSLLRRAYHYPHVNMVVTLRARNKYINGEESSQLEWRGFNEMEGIVGAMLQSYRDAKGRWQMLIQASRTKPDEVGFSIPDPTFEKVRLLLLGE